MKYALLALIGYALFSLAGCHEKSQLSPQKVVVIGKVNNFDITRDKKWIEIAYPDLFSYAGEFKSVPIDADGSFRFETELVSPALCWGIYHQWIPLVLSPGDSLTLNIDARMLTDNSTIVETGKYALLSGENNEDYHRIIAFEQWASDSIYTIASSRRIDEATKEMNFESFRSFMKQREVSIKNEIRKFGEKHGGGQLYYSILNSEIKYRTLCDIINYWIAHPMENGKKMDEIEIPERYSDFLNEYDLNSLAFYSGHRQTFISGLSFFLQFSNTALRMTFLDIWKNKEAANVDSTYFIRQARYISQQTKGITRDLCLYQFAEGILVKLPSHADEIYRSVVPLVNSGYVKAQFAIRFEKKRDNVVAFNQGKADAYTVLDSIVEQNKGKVVYVDFWAPWCGPCMGEMPASKKLREQLAGEDVVFVYLANRCSEESWKAAIDEEDIDGVNYLLDDGEYGTLSHRYHIDGIPFHLLFDKNGKQIQMDTPRPTDKRILADIKALL
jgi:thiol-disulfide isomerase/thioredoxin